MIVYKNHKIYYMGLDIFKIDYNGVSIWLGAYDEKFTLESVLAYIELGII